MGYVNDHRFTDGERELILRQLHAIEERVNGLESNNSQHHKQLSDTIATLTFEFQRLSTDVREMLQRDADQERAVGRLNLQVAALAAHSGGQAGGMTGAVTGLDAARAENKSSGAKYTLLAILVSAVTSGVAQGLAGAFGKP
jgi:hypothetical protein